jgi:hypothetical protein
VEDGKIYICLYTSTQKVAFFSFYVSSEGL